ncbi:hypothetical protein BURMUCF2_A1298 [Burkholderia multivorans CF2]|nr:hypothetical protein BURMUCGD1_4883 [Burkholderia multivorans CGD1]EJO55549.1 hypothetical protein BURMUCF2_A1298 [Burkholderia multivorans CF2]
MFLLRQSIRQYRPLQMAIDLPEIMGNRSISKANGRERAVAAIPDMPF